jgi:hypothetical protein
MDPRYVNILVSGTSCPWNDWDAPGLAKVIADVESQNKTWPEDRDGDFTNWITARAYLNRV